jgi:hypothetical protein
LVFGCVLLRPLNGAAWTGGLAGFLREFNLHRRTSNDKSRAGRTRAGK